MEAASPAELPPPPPREAILHVAGPSKGSEKNDEVDDEVVDCGMPVVVSPTLPQHLRQVLLLLLLVVTQILSTLGFALRWLGHALEELAGEKKRTEQ